MCTQSIQRGDLIYVCMCDDYHIKLINVVHIHHHTVTQLTSCVCDKYIYRERERAGGQRRSALSRFQADNTGLLIIISMLSIDSSYKWKLVLLGQYVPIYVEVLMQSEALGS